MEELSFIEKFMHFCNAEPGALAINIVLFIAIFSHISKNTIMSFILAFFVTLALVLQVKEFGNKVIKKIILEERFECIEKQLSFLRDNKTYNLLNIESCNKYKEIKGIIK